MDAWSQRTNNQLLIVLSISISKEHIHVIRSEVPRENFLKTIIFFASSCGPVVSLVLAIM